MGGGLGGSWAKVRLCDVRVGAVAAMRATRKECLSGCLGSLPKVDGGITPLMEGTVTWICSNPGPREKHTTPGALSAEEALRATEQQWRGEAGRAGGGWRVCTPRGACAAPASVHRGRGKRETLGCGAGKDWLILFLRLEKIYKCIAHDRTNKPLKSFSSEHQGCLHKQRDSER